MDRPLEGHQLHALAAMRRIVRGFRTLTLTQLQTECEKMNDPATDALLLQHVMYELALRRKRREQGPKKGRSKYD